MKRRGILLLQVISMGIVFLLLFGASAYSGAHFVNNVKAHVLMTDCDAIDRALELWAKAHQGVNADSVTYDTNGKSNYSKHRLYPANLEELGEIQEMGYFSSQTIDLSKFRYSTFDDATAYEMEVTLPNGTIYTSPRSSN